MPSTLPLDGELMNKFYNKHISVTNLFFGLIIIFCHI